MGFVLGAAFVAGFVDSIVGGGGLIQVPALLLGYPDVLPQTLLGTNKLGSICGTTSSVYRYSRFVHIPWRALLPAVGIAFVAALLGASLIGAISPSVFRPLVPLMLSAVLVYVLCHRNLGEIHAPIILARDRSRFALAGVFGIGIYDGFFGPGAGTFLMLLFIRVHGFDFLHASAAARLINVATNLGALAYFAGHSQIHWLLGLCLGACNACGSVFGIRTARRHGTRFVRRLFIAIVALLIARTALDTLGV